MPASQLSPRASFAATEVRGQSIRITLCGHSSLASFTNSVAKSNNQYFTFNEAGLKSVLFYFSTFPNYANISNPFFSALITFPFKKVERGGGGGD